MAAVALAWESQSTRSAGWSTVARQEARLTAVVVFPTPPFWLATAMMRAKDSPGRQKFNKARTRKQDVSRGTQVWKILCVASVPRGTDLSWLHLRGSHLSSFRKPGLADISRETSAEHELNGVALRFAALAYLQIVRAERSTWNVRWLECSSPGMRILRTGRAVKRFTWNIERGVRSLRCSFHLKPFHWLASGTSTEGTISPRPRTM